MSDVTVIRCCAPTLARIKTGSLFNCAFDSRREMIAAMTRLNRELSRKGVRAIPLRWRNGKCLIYVYRPQMLSEDLSDEKAVRLLRECGYTSLSPAACVTELFHRLRREEDFPHEIGLFLGYPPEDVDGFIHRRDAFKCVGLWKVYGDESSAKQTFARCRRCTEAYLRQHERGYSLQRLCVAAHKAV